MRWFALRGPVVSASDPGLRLFPTGSARAMAVVLSLTILPVLFPGCGSEDSTKPAPSDTTPPAAVRDLAVASIPGRLVTLIWTAPADEGTLQKASSYEIRYRATPLTEQAWDSATALPSPPIPKAAGQAESLDVTGLPDGSWHFALKAADDVPNWSAMSNVATASVADVVAPAPVVDLTVFTITVQGVTLHWTAPGNDGAVGRAAQYDLRYATNPISEATWAAALPVRDVPEPAAAGAEESFRVPGLVSGATYHFALKAADDAANWSALSNVAAATIEDLFAPVRVTDLVVSAGSDHSLTLAWTAPGNDEALGRAAAYDLRYALTAITDETWDAAVRAQGVPPPDSAGTMESFTVEALETGQTYFFALKTADQVPNWSGLSNMATAAVASFSLRRLTIYPGSGFGVSCPPSWSPDGRDIAFTADWSGNDEIYRIPSAGGTPIRLTDDPASDTYPAWSPDGRRIAFGSGTESGWELCLIDASDGSQRVRLATHDAQIWTSCAWSPDGTRIAYVVGTPWTVVSPTSIYLIPAGGGTAAPWIVGTEWVNSEPSWSPDGTKIAFISSPTYRPEVYVLPITGGDPVRLTYSEGYHARYPNWSPDGTRIAYTSNRTGNSELWVIPATGGLQTQMTSNPSYDSGPAWSPDGKEIAFVSDRTGKGEVWIMQME